MSDSGSQRRDPESFFLPKARTIVSVTVETRAAGSFLLFLKLILKFLGSPPLLIELPLHLLLPLQFAEPLLLLFSFKLSLKRCLTLTRFFLSFLPGLFFSLFPLQLRFLFRFPRLFLSLFFFVRLIII